MGTGGDQRLAGARRHDGDAVAPGQHRLDYLELPGPELLVAEDVAQHAERAFGRRGLDRVQPNRSSPGSTRRAPARGVGGSSVNVRPRQRSGASRRAERGLGRALLNPAPRVRFGPGGARCLACVAAGCAAAGRVRSARVCVRASDQMFALPRISHRIPPGNGERRATVTTQNVPHGQRERA